MTEPALGYAPYEILDDTERFDLVQTSVSSALGTCVAHHRARRSGTRATIFLHGAAGSWTTWTPLLQAAEIDGAMITEPVLLDLPGWGAATLTDDDREVTVDAIGSIVRELAETLGYTEWDLVGHSLGGFVAMHIAATRPQSVLSVAMVSGTTFSIIRSVEHPIRNFAEVPGFTMLWRVMRVLAPLGGFGAAAVRWLGHIGLLRALYGPLFRHGMRVPMSLLVETGRDLRPRSFSAAAEVARGYDAVGLWGGIQCQVTAMTGDQDVFVSDRDLAELGRLLPGMRRAVIDDCGHFAAVERPHEVLRILGFRSRV